MRDNKSAPTIFISAGEASGDLHGAHLVKSLRVLAPQARLFGMGGRQMAEAGVELIAHISDMAVVGLTEVASHLKAILSTMRRVRREIRRRRPDLVILIDYPDFHLPLARYAKRAGLKVMYYISPQVWAWRKGRIRSIRKWVDHMVVILPFEETLYRSAGVKCTFVGHPLLDLVRPDGTQEEAKDTLNLKGAFPVIALLPGSREKEVERLLPIMLEASGRLKQHYPTASFVIPCAETLNQSKVEEMTRPYKEDLTLVPGRLIYHVLAASDFAIVASGTATLETALMGVPMCIVYRLSRLTYLIGRLVVRVRNIGLVNIIAEKNLVPELIQGKCTPAGISETVKTILDDPAKVREIREGLKTIRERLGRGGAAKKAAALALEMIGHGNI